MSVAAHKFGGPPGAGALLLRRDVGCVPLSHGGGQERDIRSGTPDVAGAVGMATAMQLAVDGLEANSARLRVLRDRLIDGVLTSVEDTRLNGATGSRRLPGNAHFTFDGCEGDALLMLLDANGIDAPPDRRAPQEWRSRRTCCSRWAPMPPAPADRCDCRWGAPASNRTSTRHCGCCPARWPAPGKPRLPPQGFHDEGPRRDERRRRLVGRRRPHGRRRARRGRRAPGLSQAPGTLRTGSRGCCSKEDAGDARRVADVLGIPFYVWDFADKFKEDVIDDFVSSYARGETPNPCVRCNERIKFSALAARALALGFDAVATGHYARLSGGRLRRAVDKDKDQSYVLAVLTSGQLRHAAFPIGDTPSRRSAPRRPAEVWRSRRSRTATTSASSRPAIPGPSSVTHWGAPRLGDRPGGHRTGHP